MGAKKGSKRKKGRDPRQYATTSIAGKSRADRPAVSKPRPPGAAPVTQLVEPPTVEHDEADPLDVATWVSLGLAQRQAAQRVAYEETLRRKAGDLVYLRETSEQLLVGRLRIGALELSPSPVARVGLQEWTQAANFVYETLDAYGFAASHIEKAMEATHGAGGVMEALAWLCVHVPADRLPHEMRDKLEYGDEWRVAISDTSSAESAGESECESTIESSGPEEHPDPQEDAMQSEDRDPGDPKDLALADPVSLLLNRITAEDFGIEDAYASDEDPGVVCGRRLVRQRALEETADFLQANGGGLAIQQAQQMIRDEKARVSELEADLIYSAEQAEHEYLRLWPDYYDALLDDICAIRERKEQESMAARPSEEEAQPDVLDGSGSECGFGLEEALEAVAIADDAGTQAASDPVVVDVQAPARWTGPPVRMLVQEHVRRIDRQAEVRFSARRLPGGHAGTIAVSWTQPSRAAQALTSQRALGLAQLETGLVEHKCSVSEAVLAGRRARDAKDLAALAYLYVLGARVALRLAPPLAAIWEEWVTADAVAEHARVEAERQARVEFLRSLRADYESHDQGPDLDTEPSVLDPDTHDASQRLDRRAAAAQRQACAERRKWTLGTIKSRQSSREWQREFSARAQLPVAAYRQQILAAVEKSQVVVVRAATGSGKTTQIPQMLLETMVAQRNYPGGKVMCTQPRRMAAMSTAQRVSRELGDSAAGTAASLVGFQVRLNSQCNRANVLVFCTTGVLLRMLADDAYLRDVSYVVCDEVQERTLELDYLLIVLRRLARRRPSLRLVLMSATIDVSLFVHYFDQCPVVDVPGRAFPVDHLFLGSLHQLCPFNNPFVSPDAVDYGLVCRLIRGICASADPDNESVLQFDGKWVLHCRETMPPGAVLVFLPGIYEIRRLHAQLLKDPLIRSSSTVVPLHSAFANDRPPLSDKTFTELAFAEPSSPLTRKVVLATNVAETGITIPDVTIVIDSGLAKQAVWDASRRILCLETRAISKANCRQRWGRAGRTRPGIALNLYSDVQFQKMPEFERPEIQRLPLTNLCLMAKAHRVPDICQFLAQALEPPSGASVVHAVRELQQAGALDEDEQLTPIGRHLCHLPLDLRIGKLLINGVLLHCLDPVLTIAAMSSLSNSSVFLAPPNPFSLEKAHFAHSKYYQASPDGSWDSIRKHTMVSDFQAELFAYADWRRVASKPFVSKRELDEFCRCSYLNRDTLDKLEDLREQYLRILHNQGLISYRRPQNTDRSSGWSLAHAIRPPHAISFARVPPGTSDHEHLQFAAIVAAHDDSIVVPGHKDPERFVIGQVVPSRRVEGIGRAIQLVERERIATRPIQLAPTNPMVGTGAPGGFALVAATLSGTSSTMKALGLTRVPLSLLVVFAARELEYWPRAQLLVINRWIRTRCYAKTATLLMELRRRVQAIIEFRILYPMEPLSAQLAAWLDAVVEVLEIESKPALAI